MSTTPTIQLEEIMAPKLGSVDPAKFPEELFDLYSIPAFDNRQPEVVVGRSIGSAKQIVQPGDVLLSKIVPHIRRSWVVGNSQGRRLIASSEWIVFRSERIHPDYLRHVLVSDLFHAQFMNTVSGVGGSLLRARPAVVAKIEIPFPPLHEQRRIAAILDKADAIRELRRKSIAKLDTLLKSVFLEMFGDPVTNPKGWPMSSFGEEVLVLEYGPRFYNESYSLAGVRIVRITDLDSLGNLDFDAMPRMGVSDEDKMKYCLKPGDLVFARTGATVGKTALIHEGDPECIAGAYFIRMRFKDRIHPLYARMVIASNSVQAIIANRSRQSAQQNFSGPGIRSLPLPVPPIEDQLKLEKMHSILTKLVTKSKLQLQAADRLFNALQQHAFAGKLFTEKAAAAAQQELFAD